MENKENLDKLSNKMITRFVNNIGGLSETGKTRDINNVLNSLSIGVSSTGVSNALNVSTIFLQVSKILHCWHNQQ